LAKDPGAMKDLSQYIVTYSIPGSRKYGEPTFEVWAKNKEGYPDHQIGMYHPPVDAYNKLLLEGLTGVHNKAVKDAKDLSQAAQPTEQTFGF